MSFHNPFDVYSDSRSHATPGPSRNARLPKVTLPGAGFISKGEDGRIAVAGRESLRILRVLETSQQSTTVESKHATRSAFRIESTKNLWEGSSLKVDCASTDVAWAYGAYNNKILTSARNGELIMWDLLKSGHSKFERKAKEHLRSIHAVTVSRVVHHYCVTGSADGDFRIWDLRDIQSSVMRVHNPSAVRRLAFSPCVWNPLFILVGMDNGTLHRWDLKMGQRGLLDRLPVAHTAPITTMDWYSGGEEPPPHAIAISNPPYMPDDYTGNTLGWVASAGLDHCVKIWNLTGPEAGTRMPNKPTYTLHTSYPIRRVLWRPGYECEIAVVSHADFTHLDQLHSSSSSTSSPPSTLSGAPPSRFPSRPSSGLGLDSILKNFGTEFKLTPKEVKPLVTPPAAAVDQLAPVLDAVEVWDVRRSWIPKWSVTGTSVEGGVTDIEFAEPHVLLAQNMNGTFTQIDMRDISRPLDAIPRTSTTWTPQGGLAFITDNVPSWEIPYDDIHPARLNTELPPITTAKPATITKRIGDRPFRPKTQKLGTFSFIQDHLEAAAFGKIACSYVIDGNDRPALCAINTQVAIAAGKPHIAQIWMLMKASLTSYIPSPPPTPTPLLQSSPPTRVTSSLNNVSRHTTPTTALASYTFPQTAASASTSRSPDVSRQRGNSPSHHLPVKLGGSGQYSQQQLHRHTSSPSTSQKPTPVSSNSSSPLHLSSTLPAPITPRRASFLGPRRESMGSSTRRRSSLLLLRRQSTSSPAHALYNASPIDRSVKNAGEGVLSDSDSDSSPRSDNEDEEEGGEEGDDVVDSGDEETDRHPGVTANVVPTSVIASPSPLSRLSERTHWTEMDEEAEEEEEDDEELPSPSPGSTDTESEGQGEGEREEQKNPSMQRGPSLLNKSRRNSKGKTRSRSSTLASLPAGPPPKLSSMRYQSQSSIRTVTPAAADTSFQASDHHPTPVEAAGRESGSRSRGRYGVVNRERYEEQQQQQFFEESMSVTQADKVTARHADQVVAEEGQMLECYWEVLREAFEDFVLAGDVQTAATMAAIAPEELGLSLRRQLHIFDAYIDQLLKYQLYTSAAYFRKHSKVQQIKNVTLLDTTLYTACGRCKKPLMKPFGSFLDGSWKRPSFNYCRGCKAPTVTCTICRLPVRNMLFQCSICRHGGHQSCYRQFYLNQPMVDLPPAYTTAEDESRGRTSTRTDSALHESVNRSGSTVGASDYHQTPAGSSSGGSGFLVGAIMAGELVGHPCAAGCGHFCWAALKPT